jgi:hypothetical protein
VFDLVLARVSTADGGTSETEDEMPRFQWLCLGISFIIVSKTSQDFIPTPQDPRKQSVAVKMQSFLQTFLYLY